MRNQVSNYRPSQNHSSLLHRSHLHHLSMHQQFRASQKPFAESKSLDAIELTQKNLELCRIYVKHIIIKNFRA
jgi:hypothetical protein